MDFLFVSEETYSESGESQAPRRISKTFSEVVGHAQKRQHKEEGFNKVTHEINVKVSPLPPSDPLPASTKARLDVLHKAVNGFRDGHFVLVCAEVERQKYIESIALAPWTVVFDLDPNSRTSGLLSAVEEKLCSLRSLYVHSLFEKTTNFTECSTHWYSVRSPCDIPISKEFASWKKNPVVIQGLKNVIKNMESFSDVYTRFRVLILWPPDEITSRYMNHILSKLEKHFMPEMAVIDNSLMKSQDSISFLRHYTDDLGERLSLVQLSMEHVCNYIRRSCFTEAKNQQGKFVLPVSDVAIDCQIDQREASWLREVLEILYEDKQYNDSKIMPKDLLKELDNFYRGGTLPWLVRYELGAGSVDTERDLMGPIIKQVKKMKDLYKSGIIRINHAPGSGGTTLAQKVLWQCRQILPCAQVNLREGYMIGELEQRLEFLYKKTDLPLLILFDGEDEQRVEELVKSLERISLIVLFVKRYPYRIENNHVLEDQFWLNSYVSQKESSVIAVKLLEHCNDERKRENINKLADTVKMGRQVAIFEFGLAAYAHEYTGIASYVSGFLRLDQTKEEMSPWQKALAMLSFTYYYGQIGLSCQFFTDILQLGTQRVPTIDDFPNEMQSLIVPETNKKQNLIRISHYFIAKEILEQVLPWPKTKSDVRTEQLYIEDKKDLENFATMFIEEAEKIDGKKHSPAIISMLTKSFISRDNPVDEWKRQKGKNKYFLSHLLYDLKYRQPFTSCFNVLIKLTHSFPNEDHFHAHLGRLYSILLPEKEKEAEEEFRTALELCENRMGKQELEDLPKLLRRNLMTTNHMYGKMFQSRAEKFIEGNTINKTRLANMMANTYQLLKNVKCACERFQLCRFYNPGKTDDKRILEAELSVRLRFCDFITIKCPSENAIKFIEDNEEVECYREICDFLKDCILEIDCLFTDYFSSLSESEDIDESFVKHQRVYKALFKKSSPGYVTRQGDSIQSRRLHIAGMKIKSWTSDGYGDLLQIDNLDEITDIIRLYESNFKDYHKRGKQCSKKALDMDYMEWLVAIRHKKIPNPKGIEEVLQVVETWNETLKTPSSRLYLFILKSILGFGSSGCQGNTKLLTEALELKTKLSNQATYIPNSRRPREWFGKGKGIRCLELGSRYGGQKDRFINFMDLALFKGVIIGPNTNRRSGSIRVDVNRSDVIAFFVPLKAKMEGAIFAGRRVEFGIGFSFLNGYEAFSVKQLKKVKCPKCGLDNEATSRDTEIQCSKPCEYKFRIP